jgi:hypothetical protein
MRPMRWLIFTHVPSPMREEDTGGSKGPRFTSHPDLSAPERWGPNALA